MIVGLVGQIAVLLIVSAGFLIMFGERVLAGRCFGTGLVLAVVAPGISNASGILWVGVQEHPAVLGIGGLILFAAAWGRFSVRKGRLLGSGHQNRTSTKRRVDRG